MKKILFSAMVAAFLLPALVQAQSDGPADPGNVKGVMLSITPASQNLGYGLSFMHDMNIGTSSTFLWGYELGFFAKTFKMDSYNANVTNLNGFLSVYVGYKIKVDDKLSIVPKLGGFYAYGAQQIKDVNGEIDGGTKWNHLYGAGIHMGVDVRYNIGRVAPYVGVYYNADFDAEVLGARFYTSSPFVIGLAF